MGEEESAGRQLSDGNTSELAARCSFVRIRILLRPVRECESFSRKPRARCDPGQSPGKPLPLHGREAQISQERTGGRCGLRLRASARVVKQGRRGPEAAPCAFPLPGFAHCLTWCSGRGLGCFRAMIDAGARAQCGQLPVVEWGVLWGHVNAWTHLGCSLVAIQRDLLVHQLCMLYDADRPQTEELSIHS